MPAFRMAGPLRRAAGSIFAICPNGIRGAIRLKTYRILLRPGRISVLPDSIDLAREIAARSRVLSGEAARWHQVASDGRPGADSPSLEIGRSPLVSDCSIDFRHP